MKCNLTVFLVFCSILCSWNSAVGGTLSSKQIESDLRRNKQKLITLDPARNRWKAIKIGIAGNKTPFTWEDDYATGVYGKPWDFNSGMPEKLKGKRQIKNLRIVDGKLTFTTREDGEIFWGDLYKKNPEYGEEEIGVKWWSHWMPQRVKLRIKQSLPESNWEILMRTGRKIRRLKFTLKGTNWQTVDLRYADSRASHTAFGLKTIQGGNKIEIDKVSIYTPHLIRVYRKKLFIDGEVESASFCVNTAPKYKVLINGKLACAEEQNSKMPIILNRYQDMGRFFHKGENEIVVEAETKNWNEDIDSFVMEGIVYEKSGNVKLIKTDNSWQGQYLPLSEKINPKAWKPVKVLGKVTGRFGYSGQGLFLNPPHYGRIQTSPAARKLPIFRQGQKVEFNVKLFGKGLDSNKYKLSYEVTDALANDKKVTAGTLLSECGGTLDKVLLSFPPPHPGVYNITVSLLDKTKNKLVENTVFEAAVAGKIEQKEIIGTSETEGLDLELVDTINCIDMNDPHPFYCKTSRGKKITSKVIDTPLGKYRVGGSGWTDYMSWKFEFPDCTGPYMVEVDYPDDGNRIIGISLGNNSYYRNIGNDHGDRQWYFCATGVYTGFQHPVTNRKRTARAIFYPKLPVATVDLFNYLGGSTVAVSAIRIYKIKNDLPMLKFATKPSRLTGIHAERITQVSNTFYTGDMDRVFCDGHQLCMYPFHGFYKAWYQTNVNFIKYLRFCGENCFVAGLVMYYTGYLYPSENKTNMLYNCTAQADMAALLGEMFAANNMTLFLGVEYSLPADIYKMNRLTNEMVAEGKHSYSEIDRYGKQVTPWNRVGNINEPEIKKDFYRVFKDLCSLYKDNPGVKGIVLQQGMGYNPGVPVTEAEDPLYSGYSDTTMALFEKETGIRIPVEKTDKKRFAKRHKWLLKNKLNEWIKWRCDNIYKIFRRAGQIMTSFNPDWTLYIFPWQPPNYGLENGVGFVEYQRRTGFWPPMYKDKFFGMGRYYFESIRHQTTDTEVYHAGQIYSGAPEVIDMYTKGRKRTALRTGPQFYETHFPRMKKNVWYWKFFNNGSYCLPADENIPSMYNRLLAHETPYLLLQYWTDKNIPSGFEQQRRLFNRAFTVLPEKDYRNLTGNGLDSNCIVRAGGKYFYIINLIPEKMEFTLKTTGAKEIRILGTGKRIPITGGKGKITLAANALGSYKLDSGSITGMNSACPQKIADECIVKYQKLSGLETAVKSRLQRGKIPKNKIPDTKNFFATMKALSKDMDLKKYGKVWSFFQGFRMKRLMQQVKDLAVPINWMIIGPFENFGRKNFDKVFPVEKDLLAGIMDDEYQGEKGKVKWKHVTAGNAGDYRGVVDLTNIFGKNSDFEIAYAFTQIYVPETTPVKLILGSDDGLKVWVNSKQVFALKPRRSLSPGQDSADTVLKKGWNQIILKIENNVGGWGFSFDVKTLDGKDVPGLEYASNRN